MASSQSRNKSWGLSLGSLLCFAASAVGAVASIQAKSFYSQLAQPTWAPPPSLFGPVWTVLYALMAIAAWLVWRSGGFRTNRIALSFFLGQLVFNALWSWLFFAWQLGALAFADIVFLWVLIVATLVSFLARESACWCSPHSVLTMGQFRICPQLRFMAAQSPASRLVLCCQAQAVGHTIRHVRRVPPIGALSKAIEK